MPSSVVVAGQAQEMTTTFLFSMKQQPVKSKCALTKKRWQSPPVDVLKINSDGAFYDKEKRGA
jgi:uncharacterized ParB-like nuclease family protein